MNSWYGSGIVEGQLDSGMRLTSLRWVPTGLLETAAEMNE